MTRLTNLIKRLKKQHPDGQQWKSEYIYEASHRRINQTTSKNFVTLIDGFMDYLQDPTIYHGYYKDIYEMIGADNVRDFIVLYSIEAGIIDEPDEAHDFVDGFFAAEEHLEANIPLDATLSHYNVEQDEPPQEVETGITQFGEDDVLEVDGYSEEEIERFSNEEHQVS